VLGTIFDSDSTEWSISKVKEVNLQRILDGFSKSKLVGTLKEVQKLHGELANLLKMCDFMKGFKFNLLKLTEKFQGNDTEKNLSTLVSKRTFGFGKVIATVRKGDNVGDILGNPPVRVHKFLSDAADADLTWIEGVCISPRRTVSEEWPQ
jgi:hypothetical protein